MGTMNYLERLAQRATGSTVEAKTAVPRVRTSVDGPDPIEFREDTIATGPSSPDTPLAATKQQISAPAQSPNGIRPAPEPTPPQIDTRPDPAHASSLPAPKWPDTQREGWKQEAPRTSDSISGENKDSLPQHPATAKLWRPTQESHPEPAQPVVPRQIHPRIEPASEEVIPHHAEPSAEDISNVFSPAQSPIPQMDLSHHRLVDPRAQPTGLSAPLSTKAPVIQSLDKLMSRLSAGEVRQQTAAAVASPSRRPSVSIGRLVVEVTPPVPTPMASTKLRNRARRRGGKGPEAPPGSLSSLRFGLGQR